MKLNDPDAVRILEVARHPGHSTVKVDGKLALRGLADATPLPIHILEEYLRETKAIAGAWLCVHAEGCVELKVAQRQLDRGTWEGFGVTNHPTHTDFPIGTWYVGQEEDLGAVAVVEPRYRWQPKPDAVTMWRASAWYQMIKSSHE